MKYYSQYGQDQWLYENYFSNKKDGIFLEIGCIDGLHLSNTKFFEDIGWTGLCIEPSPSNYKKLEDNRNCITENIAVSNYEGESDFWDIHGYGQGLSGLTEKYDPKHVERIHTEMKNPDNKGLTRCKVKVDLLNNVLKKHKLYNIDFATIDTEGGEYEILELLDFDTFNIKMILVENNYKDDKVNKLLTKKNYVLLGAIGSDEVYLKNE